MTVDGVEISARGLAVRGPRGAVFEGVDAQVPAGGLLSVHGPAGSGRTSLLLALAGRMRLAAGTVRVGPHEIPAARRRAAALVAVARAEPAVGLEGRLRVGELVAERCWLARGVTRADIEETAERLGLTLRDRVLAEDLAPLDGLRLALALTAAERPAAIVVDDVDRGCTAEQRTAAWRSVLAVRDLGCTVLAGSLDRPGTACDDCDDEVELPRLSRDRLPTAAGHDVVNGEAQ